MKPQLYIIRSPSGKPEAIHQRTDTADGKRFSWWSLGPDGIPVDSLQGRKVETLPLFGSHHVAGWDDSRPVTLTEGEKDMLALATAGYRALGTVGGSTAPGPGPLAVLIGLDVLLWPDADANGIAVMLKVARAIEAGVKSVRWIIWPDARPGGGAADAIAAGVNIDELTANAGEVPAVQPSLAKLTEFSRRKARPSRRRGPFESRIERFNDSVNVSEVLRRDYGIETRSGRAVRCPFHDDRHPSLSILRDDRRAYCHAGTCWGNNNGRGRDAWDLAGQVRGLVSM